MRKNAAAVSIVLAIFAGSPLLFAQVPAVDSVWTAQPPKIDGSAEDWEGAAHDHSYPAEVVDKTGDVVPVEPGGTGPLVLFKYATEK
jgi:hypothetical protein